MNYFPEDVWKIIKYHLFKSYWLKKYRIIIKNLPKAELNSYLPLCQTNIYPGYKFIREFYKLHGKSSYHPYVRYTPEEMYGKHVICVSHCIKKE